MNNKKALEKINDIKSVINEFYHTMKCNNELTECARENWLLYQQYCEETKQDLDRLEKLEKVIEILKSMGIRLEHYPKSKNHPYVLKIKAFGDDLFFDLVNELRYNLLKEVLGNDLD